MTPRRAGLVLLLAGSMLASLAPSPGGRATPAAQATGERERQAPTRVTAEIRRDLGWDEDRGGHTLARHVGRSDQDLTDRLRREPRISAASTYRDRDTAERVVGSTLRTWASRLRSWANRRGNRPNLVLDYNGRQNEPIGRVLSRGARQSRPAYHAVVVLKWNTRNEEYFVLTSYPELRR